MFNFPSDFPKASFVAQHNTDDSPSICVFNGERYLVSIVLDNSKFHVEIPNRNIVNLSLKDNMIGFQQEGVLVFKNENMSIGRVLGQLASNLDQCPDYDQVGGGILGDFTFKNDGFDLLHIKILPLGDGKVWDGVTRLQGSGLIQHTYMITEVKDGGEKFSSKTATLYFEGIETGILKSTNPFDYTSGLAGRGGAAYNISGVTQYPRAFPANKLSYTADKTGESVYEIIYESLNGLHTRSRGAYDYRPLLPKVTNHYPLNPKVGHAWHGMAAPPDMDVDDSELNNRRILVLPNNDGTPQANISNLTPSDVWDFGAKSSVFFTTQSVTTSGSMESHYNLVSRLTDIHTSGRTINNDISYDPCVLKYERPRNEKEMGKITLRPFLSYYDAVGNMPDKILGEGYMGSVVIEAPDGDKLAPSMAKVAGFLGAMVSCGNAKDTASTLEVVSDFSFEPMNHTDAGLFVRSHTVTHTPSGAGAVVRVYTEEGNFTQTKKYLSANYISKIIPMKYSKNEIFDIVNIYDVTGNRADIKNHLTFEAPCDTKSVVYSYGRNRLLKSMVLLNDVISFNIMGDIGREAGKFISVTMDGKGARTNDETIAKLLGMYLITTVVHEFKFDERTYTNDILGTKQYIDQKPSKVNLTDISNVDPKLLTISPQFT